MDKITHVVEEQPLNFLKEFTAARIAIGATGNSIPTRQSLEFKLAHAHARDAVYSIMDTERLEDELAQFHRPVLQLHSMADNRARYLQRPDLGRKPNQESLNRLADQITGDDIVIVIADGLSAIALNQHIMALLQVLIPKLLAAGLKVGPLCLVQQGRVAIGDDIAHELQAKLSVVLIGERPGLSAADSMGAYLTYQPRPGLKDNSRNCISNIRPGGLGIATAADKIFYLVQESFRRKLSGVQLKDNQGLLGS
ncbi:ethanolamine ammonia-lyase subunit EutC [Mucilaginibacter phyllosphaerae]|uniref:Ethanolamine ammonia-lyase small subunit n=1 Tax=Mucilaginibacter phyllosphaerae TaxID=1812349 RepID=A0A4Y8A9W6_9SPHI|nr:ethanolamine ammonia-lyase subunit EutC [Mucilaginibacter phyllosphaerae]MBB3970671.1 ethanolamine ammonia-lyase small subunit [Mucilaginibacter phyllosphaerae]TEW64674.1 ethanolamine ammonia-lyase subunit EutC [Mucilaginibacter phyllosphaerae]GGH20183.1 ethanolamine ammonia-lyase light chain [Mucilaginibacter phyllosphaerae]